MNKKLIRAASLAIASAALLLSAAAPTATASEGYTRPQWCKYERKGWWLAPKYITIHGRYRHGAERRCASNNLHLTDYRRVSWGWD